MLFFEEDFNKIYKQIMQEYNLTKDIVIDAAKEVFIYYLKVGWIDNTQKIRKLFLSNEKEFFESKEVIDTAKEEVICCLKKGKIDTALNIKNNFNLSINSEEIIERFLEMKMFLENIKNKISDKFYEQALKSVDLLISLFRFINKQDEFIETINNNLFLKDALNQNSRFGPKLIVAYHKFDDQSKKNIKFIIDSAQSVFDRYPDINAGSAEFRRYIQDSLITYGNNQYIISEINKSGINVRKWLDYDKVRYFNLESDDNNADIKFSDIINIQLDEIIGISSDKKEKGIIDKYLFTIKDVLFSKSNNYREKLDSFKLKKKKRQVNIL